MNGFWVRRSLLTFWVVLVAMMQGCLSPSSSEKYPTNGHPPLSTAPSAVLPNTLQSQGGQSADANQTTAVQSQAGQFESPIPTSPTLYGQTPVDQSGSSVPPTSGQAPAGQSATSSQTTTGQAQPSLGQGISSGPLLGLTPEQLAILEPLDLVDSFPPQKTPDQAYYYDSSHRQEKWLKSARLSDPGTGGGWYFILPNGDLFAWQANASIDAIIAAGRLANVGVTVYADPTILTGLRIIQRLALTIPIPAPTPPSQPFYFNDSGMQEKWLRSADGHNFAGKSWYFVLPNGDLYAWDAKSISSSLAAGRITNIGIALYDDPNRLAGPDVAQRLGLTAPYPIQAGSYPPYSFNYSGAQEKWFRSANGSNGVAGKGWYFALPNGNLFAWDGTSGLGSSITAGAIGDIGAELYQHPSVFAEPGAIFGIVLANFATTGNFPPYYFNYSGASEKWLQSNNGTNPSGQHQYFILPNGDLYAWDNKNGIASSLQAGPITSVGTIGYDAPSIVTADRIAADNIVYEGFAWSGGVHRDPLWASSLLRPYTTDFVPIFRGYSKPHGPACDKPLYECADVARGDNGVNYRTNLLTNDPAHCDCKDHFAPEGFDGTRVRHKFCQLGIIAYGCSSQVPGSRKLLNAYDQLPAIGILGQSVYIDIVQRAEKVQAIKPSGTDSCHAGKPYDPSFEPIDLSCFPDPIYFFPP